MVVEILRSAHESAGAQMANAIEGAELVSPPNQQFTTARFPMEVGQQQKTDCSRYLQTLNCQVISDKAPCGVV
jgi:hypothetical protein